MRESIECAVLMAPEHEDWVAPFLRKREASERLRLYGIAFDGSPWQPGTPLPALAPGSALRQCATALMCYDVCLMPVTLRTLGWARMALAGAQGLVDTPILGLAKGMTAAGLQDLLALGVSDFLRMPVCDEELKLRLSQWATPTARAFSARRQTHRIERQADARRERASPGAYATAQGEAFRSAKERVVTDFERHYVSEMLAQYRGNISQAARASSKNRRAFWQLMRKHEIAADPYRSAGMPGKEVLPGAAS